MQEFESTPKGPDIDEAVNELQRLVASDWMAGTLVCVVQGQRIAL